MISELDFDSQLFDLKVGKLEITNNRIIANNKDLNNYDLVYIFSKTRLDGLDNKLVDTKLTFDLEVNHSIIQEILYQNEQVSEFNINIHDFNSLKKLALLSGIYSRFKRDKNLPSNSFYNLYTLWIKKLINLESPDKVFVYTLPGHNEQVIGFLSIKIENGIGTIGMIAVDNNHQGLGIGRSLLNKSLIYLKKSNVQLLKVSTQLINTSAVSFYNKLSFDESSRKYIYHIWPKKSPLINQK
ncbi:GNAT family N-acetyltransferase [Crocinitomicaceae bacterium]|nr:GNAT family N-acetyltransferase [Crocinitomicaceae bacterium]